MLIIVDTREKRPWLFDRRPCTIVRKALAAGDYSLVGHEPDIVIERKSGAGLIRSVTQGRKRFLRMMDRLTVVKWSAIIVELEWEALLEYCEQYTKVSPMSLDGTMTALMQRYPKTHWVMRPTRETAEQAAFNALRRFWLDRINT